MFDLVTPRTEEVVPLFRALHAWHAERLPLRMHLHGSNADYRAHLDAKRAAGAWLFAHDAGWGLVSYLIAMPSDEPADFQHFARRQVKLDHLYVAPQARGRGLASALIAGMETRTESEGYTTWTVGFRAFNTTAQRQYARMGAEPQAKFYARSIVTR